MTTILLVVMAVLYLHGPFSYDDAVLYLSGASSMEELEESELERFEHYREHPLDINSASRSRLLASGLMSHYQVASLLDYRSRAGDVLSLEELSLIDGLGGDYSSALAPFIVLSSARAPGERRRSRVSNDLIVRGSLRQDGGVDRLPPLQSAAALKYELDVSGRMELYWSTRNSYSSPDFSPGTMSAAFFSRRADSKLIIGDFSARFGQGLVMWSGFSMSGFSSVSSFRRSGAGLSPTGSFTPAHRGVAADWSRAGWTVSGALSMPGLREMMDGGKAQGLSLLPIVAANHVGRVLQYGITMRPWCVGADFRWSLRNASVYGETAYDFSSAEGWGRGLPATVVGAAWVPVYGSRFCLAARCYPSSFGAQYSGSVRSSTKASDELGISVGGQYKSIESCFDYAEHPQKGSRQFRGILNYRPKTTLGGLEINPSLRLSERYGSALKSPWRTEARAAVSLVSGKATGSLRTDLVCSRSLAWLCAAGLAWKGKLNADLRATLFRIDNWDDRIYVYEHDVPGSFTVPAYYGRGYSLSAYLGWRGRHNALYFRTALVSYPWNLEHKPSRLEAKLQYRLMR